MSHLTQYSLGFTVSLAASAQSLPIDCADMSKISFQVTQTDAVADFDATIEQSNDGVNWAITEATTPVIVGTIVLERVDCCARFYRLSLVRTGGTLTALDVTFNGKF